MGAIFNYIHIYANNRIQHKHTIQGTILDFGLSIHYYHDIQDNWMTDEIKWLHLLHNGKTFFKLILLLSPEWDKLSFKVYSDVLMNCLSFIWIRLSWV